MGIFSKNTDMARETPQPSDPSTGNGSPEPQRPGTSGTEMLLTNNRRRASHRLKEASRKEREYKTKKRSASARTNYNEAKTHFRQGLHHNWTGVKLSWGVVASVGYLFRDKNSKMKREAEEKRRLRALEKQRKADEKKRREQELLEKAETSTLADPQMTAATAAE